MTFFIEGLDAFERGLSPLDCPYRNLTAGHKYWIRGWRLGMLRMRRERLYEFHSAQGAY